MFSTEATGAALGRTHAEHNMRHAEQLGIQAEPMSTYCAETSTNEQKPPHHLAAVFAFPSCVLSLVLHVHQCLFY